MCVGLLAVAVVGCKTVPSGKAVPTVEALGLHNSAGVESLLRGRRIYLTNCTKCHAPEPISRHSLAEWRDLLPDMIELSHLDAQRSADVTRYVICARQAITRGPVDHP